MAATGGERFHVAVLAIITFIAVQASVAVGHPLGNFSTNHYARIRVSREEVAIHFVVDMAEISAFQETVAATGTTSTLWSPRERKAYLEQTAARYLDGLRLTIDGVPVPLRLLGSSIDTPEGVGGQPTLRVVSDFAGSIGACRAGCHFTFEDTNHPGRTGWHELVVEAGTGVEIFDSSAFASGLSDELRRYPKDVLVAPLEERAAEWSATSGPLPVGAKAPLPRLLVPAATLGSREHLAALLDTPTLPTKVALLGALLAFALGGLQAFAFPQTAMRPRGSRGTVGAAVVISLRVTVTEISEVLPLALVALIVAEYGLPERFYPAVGIAGGGLIALIGVSLLAHRSRAIPPREPAPERVVAFLPISSLLVVLLAGIACHRIGYGFVLIATFSLGVLAARIVCHQLSLSTPGAWRFSVLARALIIIAVGAAICVDALSRVRHL